MRNQCFKWLLFIGLTIPACASLWAQSDPDTIGVYFKGTGYTNLILDSSTPLTHRIFNHGWSDGGAMVPFVGDFNIVGASPGALLLYL